MPEVHRRVPVALLTGGGDKPYAFGLAMELISKGAILDVIGSDELDCLEFRENPQVRFLNLRGNQREDVSFVNKSARVALFYVKLIRYALTAKPRIFHILWNNKVQSFDRTLLMLYYLVLGKRIALTVHNVNAGKRDSRDNFLNRLTLRIQYRLAHHLFVHTEKMKRELIEEFGVHEARISVIPFGINNAVPRTELTPAEAKRKLNIRDTERTILFFGNIAPYKGLEHLVAAFRHSLPKRDGYRLVVAGRAKNCEAYWKTIRHEIDEDVQTGRIVLKVEFIPDDEVEVFFKAADVLVLPYKYVYQSGVLFLSYSFGLPVLAADVVPLRHEVIEGKTGFLFKPEDPFELARAIERFFASDLFARLDESRKEISAHAAEGHSWESVGQITLKVYTDLLRASSVGRRRHASVLST